MGIIFATYSQMFQWEKNRERKNDKAYVANFQSDGRVGKLCLPLPTTRSKLKLNYKTTITANCLKSS